MKDDPKLDEALRSIYEEVMWLAQRPNVTPGRARAWYTHVMAESVKRRIRRFTGLVSQAAVQNNGPLRLEHFLRIQTVLSSLVEKHLNGRICNASEFVDLVLEYEQVHIVTREENYAAMRAKGDYDVAGIALVEWHDISQERRASLWGTMLRGRVANAGAFVPTVPGSQGSGPPAPRSRLERRRA